MKKIILIVFILYPIVFPRAGYAQTDRNHPDSMLIDNIGAIDYSVPSSPAFTLLDVNPEKVTKPGFAKDFKLDWILKEQKIVSDIAIQFQPVWILGFGRVSAAEYRELSWPVRVLSTLNASLATTENDSTRSLAWSLKLTLRAKDPLADSEYLSKITPQSKDIPGLEELELRFIEIIERLEDGAGTLPAEAINKLRKDSVDVMERINAVYAAEIKRIAGEEAEYQHLWNSKVLDIGYGMVYRYNNPALDSLKLENKGFGFWLNGVWGFGKSIALAGLAKYVDLDNSIERLYGINFRYGSRTTNFYFEFAYEKTTDDEHYILGYGGQHKLKDDLFVKFGLQTEYRDKFELKSLIPKIDINWNLLR